MSALDDLVAKGNKKYGEGMLVRGSQLKTLEVMRAPTGSLAFDLMLGGGWPLNCWNEIIGQESSGKTTMVLKTVAANMARDKNYECLWIAAEDFVWDWAVSLGIDLKRIVVAQTRVMEHAYQTVVDALDARACDAVVIDSYPALTPTIEDEKLMEEMSVGLGAKLTNQFMRKSNNAGRRSLVVEDRPCLGLLINQWREKIGGYGDPRTTPGGKGKNFAAFTRVETMRDDWIEAPGPTKVGMSIKAKTIKNKTAPPQRTGQVDFYFEDHHPFHRGEYDRIKEISNIAVAFDILERHGAWYHYGEEKWNGKDAVTAAMREDLDLQDRVSDDVFRRVLHKEPPKRVRRPASRPAVPAKADTPVRKRIRRAT